MKQSRFTQIPFSAPVVLEEAEDSNFPPLAVIASCESQPQAEFHKAESQNSKMMPTQL